MGLLIVLLLLAVLFGVGAVVKGILWLLLLTAVLFGVAGWVGYSRLRH